MKTCKVIKGAALCLVLSTGYAQASDDKRFERLAEILGGLHHLREVCAAAEGSLWRDRMSDLLEAEKDKPERVNKMILAFNRHYRLLNETYKSCTDTAIELTKTYLDEGEALTR